MKEEYINPFLSPAQQVWKKELGYELYLEEFATASDEFTTEDLTAQATSHKISI